MEKEEVDNLLAGKKKKEEKTFFHYDHVDHESKKLETDLVNFLLHRIKCKVLTRISDTFLKLACDGKPSILFLNA